MKPHSLSQPNIPQNINIFNHLTDHAQQIEQHWITIYQGICSASEGYPHIDQTRFKTLNDKFNAALQRLRSDLQSPTLILATTGTTSSGKSTIVNLLCGADLMPRMAQEMSAGVVYIHHSPDGKRHLNIHETQGALWECGQWHDLSDEEIREKLTMVMDTFNKNKGINQPATPHIELTYPLACFSNPELLALNSLPKNTQFKLMDLPGLRNHQDNTNAETIKNCRDALCLVAYNMEETDESRRLELVQQVLGQIKHMGGSPSRMLFILNRIDVFRKDRDWERYQNEHIDKTKAEIKGILYKELPEHCDILEDLTYNPLSSLPALHAQRIKTSENRVHAADELDKHFNDLIPEDIIDDLPRKVSSWMDRDFERVSNVVWQNSYAAEFFTALDSHIQKYFPILVIPTILQRFEKEVVDVIGETARTCFSELNNSQEKYEEACATLKKQDTELQQFLDVSKQSLLKPLNDLTERLTKEDLVNSYRTFVEDLAKTKVFKQKISSDDLNNKLSPLKNWRDELNRASIGILAGIKQSLDNETKNFNNTYANYLPKQDQQVLAVACEGYVKARKKNDEKHIDEQLNNFLSKINGVISKSLDSQILQENIRIRDAVEFIMKHYIDYLQDGIKNIAPEWNLEIGYYMLNEINIQEAHSSNLFSNVKIQVEETIAGKVVSGIGVGGGIALGASRLLMLTTPVGWGIAAASTALMAAGMMMDSEKKSLPSGEMIYKHGKEELTKQLDSLIKPFNANIFNYVNKLTEIVGEKQSQVLHEFNEKLAQAHQGHQNNHEKTVAYWKPLDEQAQQFQRELSQMKDAANILSKNSN